jgi:hypothetical protein
LLAALAGGALAQIPPNGVIGPTEGTVRNHVSAILGKLGVPDRTQAALMALRNGLG